MLLLTIQQHKKRKQKGKEKTSPILWYVLLHLTLDYLRE